MQEEPLLRKKSRIKQQEKKRFAKKSANLSAQMKRVAASAGYKNKPKAKVSIKFL